MRERNELPLRVGLSRQRLIEGGEWGRHHANDFDRLWRRVCRFLRRQAGRRWADVWPEADALLRGGREDREHVANVRRRLHEALGTGHQEYSGVRSGGANLRVVDGVIVVEQPRRPEPAVTYSAAELMAHPEWIEA